MSEEDPIDFSSLDPARDGRRWEQLIRKTASRGVAARRPAAFAAQVFSWARPAVALAAGVAVVVWVAVAVRGRSSPTSGENLEASAELVRWARADAVPSDVDVSNVLGRAR